MMIWFWDNYTKDIAQRVERYASPLRATAEALRGLPPALVQTAYSDVLGNEGEAYARRLNEAGVEVVAVRYNGLIHDWGLLNPIATVPEIITYNRLANYSSMCYSLWRRNMACASSKPNGWFGTPGVSASPTPV